MIETILKLYLNSKLYLSILFWYQRIFLKKHYFGLRIVDIWNNLTDAVVEAPSINAFKNRVDELLADYHYVIDIDTAQVIKDLNKNRSGVNFKDSDLEDAPQD